MRSRPVQVSIHVFLLSIVSLIGEEML